MTSVMNDDLCKGLLATGIPKEFAHQIMNEIIKWDRSNGPEWTNQRIKDLRQWYLTYLAGSPSPPGWFKHSEEGLPLGIWNRVFKLKPAKALAVLSANTIYKSKDLLESQKEKFLEGLAGSYPNDLDLIAKLTLYGEETKGYGTYLCERKGFKDDTMPDLAFPVLFDMNGSVPVHENHSSLRPESNLGKAAKALQESWESLPEVTYHFLEDCHPAGKDLLSYLPAPLIWDDQGCFKIPKTSRTVGRVSVLQQPELKARIVGNPNRVMQVTLDPLKKVFMDTVKVLRTDVTFHQEQGVSWVQSKLKKGRVLSGSDLTSASDLLSIDSCLMMVDHFFGFAEEIDGYTEYEQYYREVCNSPWFCAALADAEHPCGQEVQWNTGSVLGTGPSFGLLTLANNCAAALAYFEYRDHLWRDEHRVPDFAGNDSFRVVGDDIIMEACLQPYYEDIIRAMGGKVNPSKTLTSDRIAEFAGNIITPDTAYLKRIKYGEVSDQSFMAVMSQLGDQAKYFLLPRQRAVYDAYRYVPGYLIEGPWSKDSFGIPLADRYAWYLLEVQPALSRDEPDRRSEEYEMSLLRAKLDSEQQSLDVNDGYLVPIADEEGYLPSETLTTFRSGGDPRLANGKTTLEVLETPLKQGRITPFDEWSRRIALASSTSSLSQGELQPSPRSEDDDEDATLP